MMTPVTSSLAALWRAKTPGLEAFDTLLNLMPQATVLVDRLRGTIVGANSALLQLTAFTQTELAGQPLVMLLPDVTLSQADGSLNAGQRLNRRKRETLAVSIKATALDTMQQWYALSIVPLAQPSQGLASWEERFIHHIFLPSISAVDQDLLPALTRVLRPAADFLGTDLLCIYQADEAYPRLKKIVSCEGDAVFPDEIPSTDLGRLAARTIWMPGRRVMTEIHRQARIAGLSYVASLPLGEEGAYSGLLVVGERSRPPADKLMAVLETLARYLEAMIRQGILADSLHRGADTAQRRIAVLAEIVENAQQGVLVLGPDFCVRELNPAAEWMLGYAQTEIEGQPAENILVGVDRLLPALEVAVQGVATHNLGNVSLHRRTGQTFPASIQIYPVLHGESPLAILVLISDVSEHEQIRERTQQLEQRAILGEFTAVFAHEVRNPINNISTGIQLLASLLPAEDANQDILNRIQGDCTRLTHLMESVLAFSKPMAHQFEAVDVGMLLQRLLDRWRPRLARDNVRHFFQIDAATPQVVGDPRALDQVFTNLISNALDAMRKTEGGTLAVRVTPNNSIPNRPQVEVTVSDNGTGIADDIRDRIFEPFVTTNPHGTGLGLPIIKRIITGHQGSISVNSFPGGTVFHVFLPAVIGEAYGNNHLDRG